MKVKFLAVFAALGIAGFAGPAAAGVDVHIGLGYPGTVYYEPAPVYYEYYEPRPVYRYYREVHHHDRWCGHGYRESHGHFDSHHGGGHHAYRDDRHRGHRGHRGGDEGNRGWRHQRRNDD